MPTPTPITIRRSLDAGHSSSPETSHGAAKNCCNAAGGQQHEKPCITSMTVKDTRVFALELLSLRAENLRNRHNLLQTIMAAF
jgi:hypothetical protein